MIKVTKTLALGICITALSANIAFAEGASQQSMVPVKPQAIDVNILPVAMYTPVSSEAREVNYEILQKQREIDKYLFEDHREVIEQLDFIITYTGPFDNYVEIGITPYNDENAKYIYNIFGKEGIRVVEGHQAVTLPIEKNIVVDPVKPIKKEVVRIQVNGEYLQLDVEPFIENDRTLIPLRGVMEHLGADVKWYPEDNSVKVSKDGIIIQLKIGEDSARVTRNIDGQLKEENIQLDVAAKLEQDRTFIPGRFVTEAIGATVDWDNSLRTMVITDESVNNSMVVENIVKGFGEKLRMVSLTAPEDVIKDSMEEHYCGFISSGLIEEWKNDTQNAPGRVTSSPWPERIEIIETKRISEYEYEVKGEIIEVATIDVNNNWIVGKQTITLSIEKENDSWLITDAAIGDYEGFSSIVYNNRQYGFNFYLPQSWEDYTVIEDEWEGTYVAGSKNKETGPMLLIRHPKWNTELKRQDIPIMIFTINQWQSIQDEELSVGAAPVGPKYLGNNEEYVFALPARYNFEFLEGYEEVENILENNSLQPVNY